MSAASAAACPKEYGAHTANSDDIALPGLSSGHAEGAGSERFGQRRGRGNNGTGSGGRDGLGLGVLAGAGVLVRYGPRLDAVSAGVAVGFLAALVVGFVGVLGS